MANPFYMSIPDWAQIPMLVLATTAAAVASPAVITGAFSVTRQAIQLGYLPRLHIKYTSKDTIGQIYVPSVNLMLYLAVVVLVLSFQSSGALATAYGLSVTGTMLIATLLLAIVAYTRWPDSRRWVLPLCGVFLVIDLAFLFANGAKLVTGIGGMLLLSACNVMCLDAAVRAFGHGMTTLSIASVAVVFLAGNALGSAAPTPGGVGAIEASLTLGLIAFGLPGGTPEGWRMTAAHSDSPTFYVKNDALEGDKRYVRLAVEGYGGMNCALYLLPS